MSREIKFRAWDTVLKEWNNAAYTRQCIQDENENNFGAILFCPQERMIIEQYTGLKDKNGDKEIYEYDIIDGEGNIIGNYHETPELLKDKTNLLIQGFGTKTWLATYQEAVERGCHDA